VRVAETPLFVKTYDLLLWLMPQTLKFPKHQRFALAQRLQDAGLDFYALILKARKVAGHQRRETLVLADVELDKLRLLLRLSHELELLSHGQYEHVSRMVVEVGNLLGAWRKLSDTQQ
jgi:hypothetical protein